MKKWSVRRLLFLFCVVFYLINFSSYADILIPEWDIPYINQDIKVDGELNESAYKKAFKWNNFVQISPGNNISPSEKTEFYVFYNKKGLVIGIIAYAPDIKYSRCKTRRDDFMPFEHCELSFDPEGNGKRFYFIGISPSNSILDGLINDSGLHPEFDFLFEHATKMENQKYTIEILIPFSEISLPDIKQQIWLFSCRRFIIRDVLECCNLCARNRDLDDVRNGKVFLEVNLNKNIKRKKLKLIPSLVVSHLKHDEEFFGSADNYNSDKGDLGLTVEYSPSTNTVFKGTIHPDFSQVEADDTYQRVNNRYPVYLREKRPFFMDGMESFSTPFELLYTRRIVKPEYGLKFSTKLKNKYGIYLISAMEKDVPSERFGYSDEFKKDVYWNVVRTTYNLDNRGSFLGFMAIERNYGSDFNRVLSTDGVVKKGNLTLKYQGVITTLSEKSGNKTGNALSLEAYYKLNQFFDYSLSYSSVSPDYVNDAGFIFRTDFKELNGYCGFHFSPEKDTTFLKDFNADVFFFQREDYSSNIINHGYNLEINASFPEMVSLGAFYIQDDEMYLSKIFHTIQRIFYISYSKNEKLVPVFIYKNALVILYGDNPQLVNQRFFSLSLKSKWRFFSISTSFFVYSLSDRVTDETIRRQKSIEVVGTYFFNDHTNFKVFYISDLADIRDYNYNQPYHYINLLFTWRKNAFTKLYIGYNNGHSTYRMTDKTMWGFDRDKYFYAKITYLF